MRECGLFGWVGNYFGCLRVGGMSGGGYTV